jgi:hypothetical protein
MREGQKQKAKNKERNVHSIIYIEVTFGEVYFAIHTNTFIYYFKTIQSLA